MVPEESRFFVGACQGDSEVVLVRVLLTEPRARGHRPLQMHLDLWIREWCSCNGVVANRLLIFWQQLDGAHTVPTDRLQQCKGFGGTCLEFAGKAVSNWLAVG